VGVRGADGGAGERVVRGGKAEEEGLPLPVGLDGMGLRKRHRCDLT